MRWSRNGLALLAVGVLAAAVSACYDDRPCCQDELARMQIQQIQTYIGHKNADDTYTGLLEWLDRVHKAVCSLEDHTTPPTAARLCKPATGGGGGTPEPPPPPPWGGG